MKELNRLKEFCPAILSPDLKDVEDSDNTIEKNNRVMM